MNQPDISSQPQENTCVEKRTTRNISAEQLRRFLCERRNKAQEVRRGLLREAAQLKDEIATYDNLLAELTTG